MNDQKTVIVLRETLAQSVWSDTVTVSTGFMFMLPGYFLGSSAMQWVGALIFFLSLLARASGKANRMTPDEAIAHIQAIKSEASK